MNRVWSQVVQGEPWGCHVQQDMPDHPGSTRCHYGPSRSQHGRYTDRPGLPRIEKSSRTVTDDPGSFKHFKTSGVMSRTMPDHPGLSRITPGQTRIGHISVRDNPGRWCDWRLEIDCLFRIIIISAPTSPLDLSEWRSDKCMLKNMYVLCTVILWKEEFNQQQHGEQILNIFAHESSFYFFVTWINGDTSTVDCMNHLITDLKINMEYFSGNAFTYTQT